MTIERRHSIKLCVYWPLARPCTGSPSRWRVLTCFRSRSKSVDWPAILAALALFVALSLLLDSVLHQPDEQRANPRVVPGRERDAVKCAKFLTLTPGCRSHALPYVDQRSSQRTAHRENSSKEKGFKQRGGGSETKAQTLSSTHHKIRARFETHKPHTAPAHLSTHPPRTKREMIL